MINVLGYIRVSTVNQVKEGYSLGEQEDEIEKFCKANNLNLIDTFKDEGISGAKTDEDETRVDRDGLIDMLNRIKEGDIKYIVVLSTNRLWRSDGVKFLICRELEKCGVDVKAIDRPTYSIYTKDPSEYLMNRIFESLDTYERMEIAIKLKRGRKKKAEGGGYSGGGAPYGYKAVRGSKVLEIVPDEAQLVRRVFDLAGGYPDMTLREVASQLTTEGYRGRNGKDIGPMMVKRILDREDFYRGFYKYGGIESIGQHDPIL